MSWAKVLAETDLPAGTRQVVQIEKQKIILLNEGGQLYAIDNACPHLKLSLKKGKITDDGAIVCPWHRSSFDLQTGEVKAWCTWPPLMDKVMKVMSEAKPLSVFPVKVEEGNIWIDI